MNPIVLHIPHSATFIPPFLREAILLDDEQLALNQSLFTDWRTRDLFTHAAFPERVVYPVSRLVCDPERFRDDAQEDMAARGIGAVYVKDAFLRPFRSLDPITRELMLQRWYDPHHASLERTVERRVAESGHCLVIDAHSFHGTPLPYEPNQASGRPDICLGTTDGHTPKLLLRRAIAYFQRKGYTVGVNWPYAGSMVPLRFLGDDRVQSLMVEINRDLYVIDPHRKIWRNYAQMKRNIGGFLRAMAG